MTTNEPTPTEISEAARIFGSIGGKAGTGASKRRPHEHYVAMGKKGMKKRWAKKKGVKKK